MAVQFNDGDVGSEPLGANATRKRLITNARVKDTSVLLERWTLGADARIEVAVPSASIAWFFVLSGAACFTAKGVAHDVTDAHTGLLPLGYRGTLTSAGGAEILVAEIPDAAKRDSDIERNRPPFCAVDWRHEPLLDSKHDKRNRIYVATPAIMGTTALKAEMIIYPPSTSGSNHHHEGAEHFKYVLKGGGTGYTNEVPHRLRAGDIVYHYDGERHYSQTQSDERMEFIEFFVPGEFSTHWVDTNRVCTWLPTGKDSRGTTPSRAIKAHSSADVQSPADV